MERVRGATLEAIMEDLRGAHADPRRLTGTDMAAALARLSDTTAEPGDPLFEGSWEDVCLRVIREVAEALDHAHRRGILHRDLKPSNIMLSGGADGACARLLDFGLASSSGDARITASGSRLGSLEFMSPEQARGETSELTPTTDIYSLGVTLYELLTLGRPFRRDSEVEILLAVQRGDLRPPRECNPAITWEAETVTQVAMERDPLRRYAGADALSRDLLAALEHRPLVARRAGPLLRLRRWVQRHPTATVGWLLGLLLVVGGPLFFLWRERVAATAIRGQLQRAEDNLGLALQAVDRMLLRVADEDLRLVPQMEPVRTALLEDAVALTEALLVEEADDVGARRAAARAHGSQGKLFLALGRSAEGLAALQRSRELLAALTRSTADDPSLQLALARVDIDSAKALRSLGRYDDAELRHLDAERRLGLVAEGGPTSRELRYVRAGNWLALARLRADRFDREDPASFAAAEEAYQQATDSFEALLAADGPEHDLLDSLGLLYSDSSRFLLTKVGGLTGARPRERDLAARGVEHLQSAVDMAPGDPATRVHLELARLNLSTVYRTERDYAAAEALALLAVDALRDLVADFPSTLQYKMELAGAYNQVGSIFDWQGDDAGAARWYQPCVQTMLGVVDRAPRQHELRQKLAIAELNLGAKLMVTGGVRDARQILEDAVANLQRASREYPESMPYRRDLRWVAQAWADACQSLGDHAGMAAAAQAMVDAEAEHPTNHSLGSGGPARGGRP